MMASPWLPLALLALARQAVALATPAAATGIRYSRLGTSDLLVSQVCLGGMTWGSQNDENDASQQLSTAWDFGVNFVDTAEAYPVPLSAETQGRTDRAIAKWMKATKQPRDKVIISTKVCGYSERYTWLRKDGQGTRLTKEQILESVDSSLKRLETDYVDLLVLHWPDRRVELTNPLSGQEEKPVAGRSLGVVPFEEQVEALAQLVAEGKIRHWGLSNENSFGVNEFRRAAAEAGLPPPACVQNAYSLLQRADEFTLIPEAMALDEGDQDPISYVAYSPLSGGVLTGKYALPPSKSRVPKKRSRLGLIRGYEESFKATRGPAAVAAYLPVAARFQLTPTQLAIAHCNSREFITSTVIGATSMGQLAEDLTAFQVAWTPEMEEAVLEVYNKFPDPWRVQVRGGG